MTPEQALQFLDQVASQTSLPRAGHAEVQRAIQTLIEAIKPKEINEGT